MQILYIFDLETKQYSVYPIYKNLVILDLEKGYYAVPQNDDEENWMNYQIVDGTGTILLPQVLYEDWLMISGFGNGYLERSYDYTNWQNGWTYRYYDENLQLKKVYCQSAHTIPDDDKRMEGVEYYLAEQGCLVDENGEILIIEGLFLERYGDGEDTNCKLSFNSVTMEGERSLYPILYQNMLYLVNRNLDLVKIVDYSEGALNGQYFKDFRYYYDVVAQEYVYQTYEGSPVTMWDGSYPDDITISWEKDEYLLYRREGNQLFVEEYTQDGRNFYTYPLKAEDTVISVSYHRTHEIAVLEDSGETIQNPFSATYQESPIWEMSFYYKDTLVTKQYGLYEYMTQLEDGYRLWTVTTGNKVVYESESLYEESVSEFAYQDYILMKKDKMLYEMEDAYMLFYGLEAIQFVKGSYVYSVGWDGTPYIRALHTVMGQD